MSELRCRQVQPRLSAFLDDELDDAEAVDLARHVARCDACTDELDGLRLAREALRGLPTLMAPARMSGPPAEDVTTGSRTPAIAGFAVAALVALLGGAFAAGGEGGDVVPPVDDFVADHVARTGGDPVLTPVKLGP